jgi:hypothetical protein
MKLPILGIVLPIWVAGCVSLPSVQNAELAQFTSEDLDAAILIAEQGNDQVAANCYREIKTHYVPSGAPQALDVQGAFSAHAAARQVRRAVQAGVPEPVHLACAPLVVDAQSFVIRRVLD